MAKSIGEQVIHSTKHCSDENILEGAEKDSRAPAISLPAARSNAIVKKNTGHSDLLKRAAYPRP